MSVACIPSVFCLFEWLNRPWTRTGWEKSCSEQRPGASRPYVKHITDPLLMIYDTIDLSGQIYSWSIWATVAHAAGWEPNSLLDLLIVRISCVWSALSRSCENLITATEDLCDMCYLSVRPVAAPLRAFSIDSKKLQLSAARFCAMSFFCLVSKRDEAKQSIPNVMVTYEPPELPVKVSTTQLPTQTRPWKYSHLPLLEPRDGF